MQECHFWGNMMLRQPCFRASRASPAQKSRGLRVVLFQKLFKAYIFCFLGHSVGRYIFELFTRETNLKKKHSVSKLLGPAVYFADPVKAIGLFGQSNMHSTLDIFPRPARKETNVPLHKRS